MWQSALGSEQSRSSPGAITLLIHLFESFNSELHIEQQLCTRFCSSTWDPAENKPKDRPSRTISSPENTPQVGLWEDSKHFANLQKNAHKQWRANLDAFSQGRWIPQGHRWTDPRGLRTPGQEPGAKRKLVQSSVQ